MKYGDITKQLHEIKEYRLRVPLRAEQKLNQSKRRLYKTGNVCSKTLNYGHLKTNAGLLALSGFSRTFMNVIVTKLLQLLFYGN